MLFAVSLVFFFFFKFILELLKLQNFYEMILFFNHKRDLSLEL